MNIQKILAQIGVLLITCAGAIIFFLTKDLASNISDDPSSKISALLSTQSGQSSPAVTEIPERNAVQLNFDQFKAINPDSATPALTLFQQKSKSGKLSLNLKDGSGKLIALKLNTLGQDSTATDSPAQADDLNFEGNHELISNPISPQVLTGNRVSIILTFRKDKDFARDVIEEPFGWGNCLDNRAFVHLSGRALNFHYGPSEERIDIKVNFNNLTGQKQTLILDLKSKGTELEKNVYLNSLHIGRVVTLNSKANFSIEHPLILGSSLCHHPFRGKIINFYVFKDLTDDKLMGITKFLNSPDKK